MLIPSSISAWNVLIFLLSISSLSLAKEYIFDDEFLHPLPLPEPNHDLDRMESTKSGSVAVPDSKPDQEDIVGEESKDSIIFRSDKKQAKTPHKFKVIKFQNVTDEKYNFVQWYSEPESIKHHVGEENVPLIQTKSTNHTQDLNAQSSSYEEGYSRDHGNHDHHHGDDHQSHYYGVVHNTANDPHRHAQGHLDHKHHDHHHGAEHLDSHHSHGRNGNIDGARDDFSEKRKHRKIKKKCKKNHELPERADTIVHSRSKTGAEISQYNVNAPHVSKAISEPVARGTFNSAPKLAAVLPLTGFSGQHLHGIPRTQYISQKSPEKGNHIHLHNHHHHYSADGKKLSTEQGPVQGTYRNLVQSLSKLKSMLPIALSGMIGTNPQASSGLATNGGAPDVKLAQDIPKKGYHYTGPHKSYGRKTYYRYKTDESDSSSNNGQNAESYNYAHGNPEYPNVNDGAHSIGADMFKHGVGPYGTDEFQVGKGRLHNEVSLGVDKAHSYEHSQPEYGHSEAHSGIGHEHPETYSHVGHEHPETHTGHRHPETYSYTGHGYPETHTGHEHPETYSHAGYGHPDTYSHVGHEHPETHSHSGHPETHSHSGHGHLETYSHDVQNTKSGSYHDHPVDYESDLNQGSKEDKYSPDYEEKAPYVPYEQIKANRAKDFDGGYGLRQNAQQSPYDGQNGGKDDLNSPNLSHAPSAEIGGQDHPKDGINYSGEVDQHFYDPEKDHIYRDLRPEPDPLSIPKNARIIEHHIRLHPMHYRMFQQIPLDFAVGGGFVPQPFASAHIPVHKLLPNPLLKVPSPSVPSRTVLPIPRLSQLLKAYQSRSLYHRWW